MTYLASDELRGRDTGRPGIAKAAEYLEETLRKFQVKPYFSSYRDHFTVRDSIEAFNIVGYIEGSDPALKNQLIILGAHYDHIGIQKPIQGDSIANGANDNASGTTAVLELAKYFSTKKPKRSILFCFFSGEEIGLKGSLHLAKKLKEKEVTPYVMFNFEMLGVPMKNKPYLAYLTGFQLSNFGEKFNQYAQKEVLGYLPQAKDYHLFYRSDNLGFYKAFHIPAHTLSSFDFTNFPYYHKVQDEAQLMDIAFMKSLIDAVIPGIEKLANTPKKEIKMNKK